MSPYYRYVFISQKAYQDSETRPENSVYTKMKGTALQGDHVLDMVEYVRPSEVSQLEDIIFALSHNH
jgi:hypothetical protein